MHKQVARVYKLYGAEKNLGLLITEGPHKDTQDLQVPAFRWFNRWLKGDEGPVETVAVKLFEPPQLRVFDRLPDDQVNTTVQETFVPTAPPPKVPETNEAWEKQRDGWMRALREQTFRGWPEREPELDLKAAFDVSRRGVRLRAYDFTSQHDVRLRLYVTEATANADAKRFGVVLVVWTDELEAGSLATLRVAFEDELKAELAGSAAPADERKFARMAEHLGTLPFAMAFVAPRGVGLTAWGGGDPKKDTQVRRRFALLGQTVDGMRVWDVRRAVRAVRTLDGMANVPVELMSAGPMAGVALYASLFESNIERLGLWDLPAGHRAGGPDLLNVLRTLDLPAAVAMAAERSDVRLHLHDERGWDYPAAVARKLEWPERRLLVDDPYHQ